jgi:hypothetical protein
MVMVVTNESRQFRQGHRRVASHTLGSVCMRQACQHVASVYECSDIVIPPLTMPSV